MQKSKKKTVVRIVTTSTASEAGALMAVLRYFDRYQASVILTTNKTKFLKTLSAKADVLVLAVHGVKDGIYLPTTKPLPPKAIAQQRIKAPIVVNLGCSTFSREYAAAFHKAGVKTYIGTDDDPEGDAALLFATNLFYWLKQTKDLQSAYRKASQIDKETKMFKLSS